ncbi:hypothetical protein ACWEWX_28770, partial [Streptomyces asiaticus]
TAPPPLLGQHTDQVLAELGYTPKEIDSDATVGSLLPGLPQAVKDLNVGVIALVLNTVAMVGISAVTRTAGPAPATTAALRPEPEATAGTG